MAFDFKKEFKEYYLPATKPAIAEMPVMNYLAVRGKGNPNEEGGERCAMGDPRKTAPDKLKTVIRYPVKKA